MGGSQRREQPAGLGTAPQGLQHRDQSASISKSAGKLICLILVAPAGLIHEKDAEPGPDFHKQSYQNYGQDPGKSSHDRDKNTVSAHEDRKNVHHDLHDKRSDLSQDTYSSDKGISDADHENFIRIFVGQVSEFMSERSLDLVVRHIEKPPCNAYGASSGSESIRRFIFIHEKRNVVRKRRILLLCSCVDLVEQRCHAGSYILIRDRAATRTFSEEPFSEGRERHSDGDDVDHQAGQHSKKNVPLREHGADQSHYDNIYQQINAQGNILLNRKQPHQKIYDIDVPDTSRSCVCSSDVGQMLWKGRRRDSRCSRRLKRVIGRAGYRCLIPTAVVRASVCAGLG